MCDCGETGVSRRTLLQGAAVGAVALAVNALGQSSAVAQTREATLIGGIEQEAGETGDVDVQLPPTPTLPDEKDIVRYVELPDASQVNGYTPESVEASPERKAELEARDRYLATLAMNEQGDISQIQIEEGK